VTSLLDLLRQTPFVGKRKLVFSRQHGIPKAPKGIAGDRAVLFGTENEADRRILIRQGPMFASIVQVEIHLSGIGVRELADLQIDNNETAQTPIEEQQVDAVPFRAYAEPPLARNECEIVA
jgi:hypothetical protein